MRCISPNGRGARHRPRRRRAWRGSSSPASPAAASRRCGARLEAAWGAKVTEAMGIGDIAVSLWGECEAQEGMHFCGRGFVHFELIDPGDRRARAVRRRRRGRTRLHASAPPRRRRCSASAAATMSSCAAGACACGRTAPRVRCIGRTDDMLIVRGVNVFPTRAPRGRRPLRAGGQRRHRGPAAAAGRPAGAAAAGRGRAGAGPGGAPGSRWRRIREPAARGAAGRPPRSSWCRGRACRAATTSRSWSTGPGRNRQGEDRMRKLQTQGVHHITLVGADRQTSIDFWEGVLGMPFVFEQPNLDRASESHLYFDPGDGRLITVFTDESAQARPDAAPRPSPAASTTSPSRCRARPSCRRWSGSTSAASSTAASRTAASWIRSISRIRSAC